MSGLQPPAPYGVFSTMSAGSPPQGKAAAAFQAERSGDPDFWRLSTHFAYGLTNTLEISASIPYVENVDDGIEDIAFGLKHRFFDEGKYGPSIAYLVSFSVPSGVKVLTTDGRGGGGIIISKRVGPVQGHANLFYFIPFDDRSKNELRFSAGVDFSAAHGFRILGELFGRSSHRSGEIDQLEARIGYRVVAWDNWFTTLGAGFDIKNRDPAYRLMIQISLLFPLEKKTIKKVYEQE